MQGPIFSYDSFPYTGRVDILYADHEGDTAGSIDTKTGTVHLEDWFDFPFADLEKIVTEAKRLTKGKA